MLGPPSGTRARRTAAAPPRSAARAPRPPSARARLEGRHHRLELRHDAARPRETRPLAGVVAQQASARAAYAAGAAGGKQGRMPLVNTRRVISPRAMPGVRGLRARACGGDAPGQAVVVV